MKGPIFICSFLAAVLVPLNAATLTFLHTTNGGSTFVYSGSVQNNQEVRTGDHHRYATVNVAAMVAGTCHKVSRGSAPRL
jgi:hypothetical protein